MDNIVDAGPLSYHGYRNKSVRVEDWEKITVEEIDREIDQLPTIILGSLSVDGGNNYHA